MALCEDCLNIIVSTLSDEAKIIFKLISKKEGMHKLEIQQQTGLSYTINNNAITELEHKQLVVHKEYGRSKPYYLTDSGKDLVNKLKGGN